MSEKSSLRRFSELRRQRRMAKLPKNVQADFAIAASDKRVTLNLRASVLPSVPNRLKTISNVLQLSQPRMIGNILEWFVVQPELIQNVVAARQ